ncbi:MAG TPA: DNA polymerase III subunit delta' [Povalibacter sp.]|mgnify:CR=1 FL=1|uniref:DNA polymerase III subunit delta' n=1 Tax=Povalibacter sp. TaxID=1962978 RepID=UPI002D1D8AD5|nr:DNA polymerase III subunit delta' [Povalibacter sp.]HMN43308.1 DNA polymerase III subunit delta' [Povalibacter sp.]
MAEETSALPPAPRLYPWHAAAIEQMKSAWEADRLPHAILLQGADGLGTRQLAAWLAAAVLCESSTVTLQHCGKCASCQLIAAGSHPDLHWVRPEEGKQLISVDQIRDDAVAKLTQTSYLQGYKVVIVDPAHQMTPQAANSLLKTLEEPTPRSVLILVTSKPSSLLPTVRSRCQKLSVSSPPAQETLQWLQQETGSVADRALIEFTGNAPLRALEFAGERFSTLDSDMQGALNALVSGRADVTHVAAEWTKKNELPELPNRLTWLDLWLTSVARRGIGGTADLFTFPARSTHLPSLPATLNISAIYGVVDQIRALKAQLVRTALQRELAIESLLFAVLRVIAPAPRH